MIVKGRARDHTTWQVAGRSHKREIRVGSNFETPGNGFAPSLPGVAQAGGAPPDWAGAWDFSLAGLKAPLQVFARDAMDVGNRAMVGARLSERPSSWWNLKAMNVNPVDAIVSEDGMMITYPGLWDGCDLVFDVMPLRLAKRIVIWDKAIAPSYFEFSVQYAPSHDFAVVGGTLRLSENGSERLRTDPVWGKDSATTGPGPDGSQDIPVTLTEQPPAMGRPVVRVTPDPGAMVSAIGTVTLDPTTVVSGAASLEDNYLRTGGYDNFNHGSAPVLFFTQAGSYRSLLRALTSALPAGEYNGVDLSFYSTLGNTRAYLLKRVLPGNDWVAGSSNGTAETGASCWAYTKYASQSWLGSAGCSSSGTDYYPDQSLYISTYTANVWETTPFTATGVADFQSWVDGDFANEGFVLGEGGGSTSSARFYSQEGTHPWYLTIDYTEPPSGSPYYYRLINRARK